MPSGIILYRRKPSGQAVPDIANKLGREETRRSRFGISNNFTSRSSTRAHATTSATWTHVQAHGELERHTRRAIQFRAWILNPWFITEK